MKKEKNDLINVDHLVVAMNSYGIYSIIKVPSYESGK